MPSPNGRRRLGRVLRGRGRRIAEAGGRGIGGGGENWRRLQHDLRRIVGRLESDIRGGGK